MQDWVVQQPLNVALYDITDLFSLRSYANANTPGKHSSGCYRGKGWPKNTVWKNRSGEDVDSKIHKMRKQQDP